MSKFDEPDIPRRERMSVNIRLPSQEGWGQKIKAGFHHTGELFVDPPPSEFEPGMVVRYGDEWRTIAEVEPSEFGDGAVLTLEGHEPQVTGAGTRRWPVPQLESKELNVAVHSEVLGRAVSWTADPIDHFEIPSDRESGSDIPRYTHNPWPNFKVHWWLRDRGYEYSPRPKDGDLGLVVTEEGEEVAWVNGNPNDLSILCRAAVRVARRDFFGWDDYDG